jgi:hypothetical protein
VDEPAAAGKAMDYDKHYGFGVISESCFGVFESIESAASQPVLTLFSQPAPPLPAVVSIDSFYSSLKQ